MVDVFSWLAASLLMLAAISDLRALHIPNWISVALVGAFAASALAAPDPMAALVPLGPALLVFAGAAGIFALGLFGGGDAKLLPAAVLWVVPAQVPLLLCLVAILGGIIAVLLVLVRPMIVGAATFAGQAHFLEGIPVLSNKRAVPYGVAISGATILMMILSGSLFGPIAPF
jgi:prepilin peptidase CpaA